jgi:DNA polymerase-3 subunit gamma/tau
LSEKKEKTSSSPNFSLPENLSQINNLPPDETWKNLLKFIRTKKPLLASLLEHGKLINLNLDSIEIGFPPNSFFLERIQEKSKKQELMKICEEFFGKRKEIIFSSPESNKTKEEETLPLAQRNEKLREEAKNHPKVKEVLNMFGGTITEIKIKKD